MAYKGRCALSGLPEPLLLDAAHIVADTNERFGQPVVPNGLPLSKIHHAAFDAHLIGIDPDYRLHVSERLLGRHDGPMLKALTQLDGGTIHLPSRAKDRPRSRPTRGTLRALQGGRRDQRIEPSAGVYHRHAVLAAASDGQRDVGCRDWQHS